MYCLIPNSILRVFFFFPPCGLTTMSLTCACVTLPVRIFLCRRISRLRSIKLDPVCVMARVIAKTFWIPGSSNPRFRKNKSSTSGIRLRSRLPADLPWLEGFRKITILFLPPAAVCQHHPAANKAANTLKFFADRHGEQPLLIPYRHIYITTSLLFYRTVVDSSLSIYLRSS